MKLTKILLVFLVEIMNSQEKILVKDVLFTKLIKRKNYDSEQLSY